MIVTILRQQPRAAALVLGLIVANLLAWGWAWQAFGDSGGLWRWVGALNDNLGDAGFVVIGLFIACWVLSVLNYRWRGYDNLAQ